MIGKELAQAASRIADVTETIDPKIALKALLMVATAMSLPGEGGKRRLITYEELASVLKAAVDDRDEAYATKGRSL